ncbi:host specificity factor TipJ family phage tail protein [Endozoicomonas sp. Mp262]|uniref:host specificity factor TipJ family phage tail protein n=1 Tax=Endozoicomonas sp. Mp262 TaxID=2919499 RepID=UPI0021D89C0F
MNKVAWIIEWPNILRPRENEVINQVEAGQTLHEWMTANVPGYSQQRKSQPVECLVNGKVIEPERWPSLELREGLTVVLAVRPFGWEMLAYAAVALVAAAVAISAMPPPPSESVLPNASPAYDATARGNQARLMNPIPFACGYNRHWMDMLTEPWREYVGNDQYLYQLFSICYGAIDLEPLQIGETVYSSYQDIEYEVYGPDDRVTLFPDNVDTSDEVAGIELFGPNEEEHDGWTGPYVLVKRQQKANYLACDFAARAGIYGMDDDGDLYGRTAAIEIQYQEIDEEDNPVSAFIPIPLNYSGATTTPQRWSHRWEVKEGRYQVRVKRVNNAGTDTRTKDSMHWEGAKAYYPSKQDYPGITKLAVRVRASNNLSQQSETQFNIKGTALVPVWNGKQWSAPQKTRDIAWAFCNAIRSAHGGRLSEDLIDLDNILSLHQQWQLHGETVCRIFDTRGTLLGALQEIVACGRGTVIPHNGKFMVVRDMQRMIRRHMYHPFMMQSAPTVERSFIQSDEHDSIIIEYYNQAIWDNDEILCQLPNHPAENPKRITLRGVPSRDHAWRIGIFECAKMLYRRMQISFTTEMQALNSIWGDKVGVSYWLRGWGQSGELLEWDGLRATLSDDVELHPSKQNFIALCREDGTFAGPYKIESAGPDRVLISDKLDFEPYTGDRRQRTLYQVGTDGAFCKDFLVTEISGSSGNDVNVTAVWDNPTVYTFESLPAPPPSEGGDVLPRPVKPVISKLVIVQDVTDPQAATLSWQSSAGVREFVVEHSIDNKEWARVAIVTMNTWSTRLYNGNNWFRIAGVADTQGDWEYGHIELTGKDFEKPPATVIKLVEPFNGPVLKVKWDTVLSAEYYTVEVVKNSTVLYQVKQYPDTQWEYSAEQGNNHGSGRAFTVRVTPVNARGVPGVPAELGVRNEPPAVPDNINVAPLVDAFIITCNGRHDPDLRDLRVWGSQTTGFTASADNLLQITTTNRFDLNLKGQWYFRLAWVDVWGVAEVNLSGEVSGKTASVDMSDIEKDIKDLDDKINSGIDEVNKNVGSTNQKLDELEKDTRDELDKISNDLSGVDSKVDSGLSGVNTSLDNLEKETKDELNKVSSDLSDLDIKTDNIKVDVENFRQEAISEAESGDSLLLSGIKVLETAQSTNDRSHSIWIKEVEAGYKDADKALESKVSIEIETVSDANKTTAQKLETVVSDYKEADRVNQAAIQDVAKTSAEADAAFSKQLTTIKSEVDGNKSAIQVANDTIADTEKTLSQRITTVQSEVDGNKATIQDVKKTTAEEDQALSLRITNLKAEVDDNKAEIEKVEKTGAEADEAFSKQLITLNAEVAGNKSAIQVANDTIADTEKTLSQRITTVQSEVDGNKATIQDVKKTSADEDQVLSLRITNLKAEVDGNKAHIDNVEKVSAEKDESLTQKITTLTSEVGNNKSAIQTTNQTIADTEKALSEQISTVQADLNGTKSSIQQNATAIATVEGGVEKLQTQWSVTMDVDGYCSGLAMNNDGKRADALFRVDTFGVGAPGKSTLSFAVQDGKVVMPGVSIQDGSIIAEKMNVDNLTSISANLGHAVAGTFETDAFVGPRVVMTSQGYYPIWIGEGAVNDTNGLLYYDKRDKSLTYKGQLDIKSAKTGGRLEIRNDYIRVYDESNRLRVEIGELT